MGTGNLGGLRRGSIHGILVLLYPEKLENFPTNEIWSWQQSLVQCCGKTHVPYCTVPYFVGDYEKLGLSSDHELVLVYLWGEVCYGVYWGDFD